MIFARKTLGLIASESLKAYSTYYTGTVPLLSIDAPRLSSLSLNT